MNQWNDKNILTLSDSLDVGDGYKLYYRVSGNRFSGYPVIILHGGPGAFNPNPYLKIFDKSKFYLISFDQRGCGSSKPKWIPDSNTIDDQIEDIERIRKHFKLNKVTLFAGSWGTTLALLYTIRYPENVASMLLRGIFLARQEDIDFLYEPNGAATFYPEAYKKFYNAVAKYDGEKVLEKYYNAWTKILKSKNAKEKEIKLIQNFCEWEESIVTIEPQERYLSRKQIRQVPVLQEEHKDLFYNQLHFFLNKSLLPSDNYILENAHKIKDIRTYIVHGRQDVDTRPIGAYLLAKELNNVKLTFINGAAHSINEPGINHKLKVFADNIYDYLTENHIQK
ncbi:alpha/beta fold hydrolase [Mycoplasma sp. AC1221]